MPHCKNEILKPCSGVLEEFTKAKILEVEEHLFGKWNQLAVSVPLSNPTLQYPSLPF